MCNNDANPSWGAGNLPLARWLGSQYENEFSTPMGWDPNKLYNNYKLPIVRKVSNDIIGTTNQQVTGKRHETLKTNNIFCNILLLSFFIQKLQKLSELD